MIELPGHVKAVANAFNAAGYPIYIVGGAVRASLMGIAPSDFDMAGPALPAQASAIIESTPGLSARVLIERLGTLHIAVEGYSDGVEYTTFRTESYGRGHTPDDVAFTTDLAKDAFRRDFTCNAIYMDAVTGELNDPTGGEGDICLRRLRATTPEVMRDDGLRLLRMVRFAAQLRFTIDDETYGSVNPDLLREIARERIGDEIEKILLSDVRYDLPYGWAALVRALYQLNETGLLEAIIPGANMDDNACAEVPAQLPLRLAAWLRPMGGERAVEAIRERLRMPVRLANAVKMLIDDLNESSPDIPYLLSRRGREYAEQLCGLRPQWREELDELKRCGAPEDITRLAVGGEDIACALGGPSPAVGQMKDRLFRHVIANPGDNRRDVLMELIAKWSGGRDDEA